MPGGGQKTKTKKQTWLESSSLSHVTMEAGFRHGVQKKTP